MVAQPLPRYVIPKKLASGRTGYYFNVPTYYRSLGVRSQTSRSARTTSWPAERTVNGGRAAALNGAVR